MSQPFPPAGWYPDPSGAPGQRYFDGQQWFEQKPSNTGRAATRSKAALGITLAAIFVVPIGGCVAMIALSNTESWRRASAQGDAERACEDAVKLRLKHPAVAEFTHTYYRSATDAGGNADVRGTVETVNSFNAPVTVTFGCRVTPSGVATVSTLYEP